jgi:hypothetical protein
MCWVKWLILIVVFELCLLSLSSFCVILTLLFRKCQMEEVGGCSAEAVVSVDKQKLHTVAGHTIIA